MMKVPRKEEEEIIPLQKKQNKTPLESIVAEKYKMHYLMYFITGIYADMLFNFIMIGAEHIAIHFRMINYVPLFVGVNQLSSFFGRIIQSKYFIHHNHLFRILMVVIINAICFCLLGAGLINHHIVGFYLAILASSLGGMSYGGGEATGYGFLKSYPDEMLPAWTAGIACSGLLTNFLLLAMLALNFSLSLIYFLQLSHIIVMYLCFRWIYLHYLDSFREIPNAEGEGIYLRSINREGGAISPPEADIYTDNHVVDKLSDASSDSILQQEDPALINKFTSQLFWSISKILWWQLLNLFLVYIFEFFVVSTLMDRVALDIMDRKESKGIFVRENAYVLFYSGYLVGQTLARGSLNFFRFPRIGILTVLQSLNVVLWLFLLYYMFIENVFYLLCLMFYVGLMGGTSLVNIMNQILESRYLLFNEKEVALVIALLAMDVSVFLSSLIGLCLNHTLFTRDEI